MALTSEQIDRQETERSVASLEASLRSLKRRLAILGLFVAVAFGALAAALVLSLSGQSTTVDWSGIANAPAVHYAIMAVVVVVHLIYQRR